MNITVIGERETGTLVCAKELVVVAVTYMIIKHTAKAEALGLKAGRPTRLSKLGFSVK
jgi:hypothetical protein